MFARTLQRSLPVFSARTFATSARTMSSASIPVPTDFNQVLYSTLEEQDPEVAELIEKETWRQFSGLESVPFRLLLPLPTPAGESSLSVWL